MHLILPAFIGKDAATACANGWPHWLAAHAWSSQRWSTSVAERDAPRTSRLRKLGVRHPEIHTDPRTVCDEWKSGSSALLLIPRGSLTHRHPQLPLPQMEVSTSLEKEGNSCMSAVTSPLSPSSFGASANVGLPDETHAWT